MASRKIDQFFVQALPALVFAFFMTLMLGCTEDKRNKDVVVAAPAPAAPAPTGPLGPDGQPIVDAWWDGNQLPTLGCDQQNCNPNIGQLIVHGRRGARGCSAVLIAPQVAVTASSCLNEFDLSSREGMSRRCAVQFSGEYITCRRIVNGRRGQDRNGEVSLLALERAPRSPSFMEIAQQPEVAQSVQSMAPFRIFGVDRNSNVRSIQARECVGRPTNLVRAGSRQSFEGMEFDNCPVNRSFLGGSVVTPSGRLVGIITSISDRRAMTHGRGSDSFQVTRIFPPHYDRNNGPGRGHGNNNGDRFTLEWRDWKIDFNLD